tara:strand:- start:401 stop:832 length:432 start_codon:yes stop_codon:yes gene_type:complete
MEPVRSKSKDSNCSDSSIRYFIRNLWFAIAISSCAVGCQALKESTIVATGAGTGAVVGTVISGGVGAPILGAMTGAFATDVMTEVLTTGQEPQTIIKAPDNFFTLLGSLAEMGGWLLILIIVIPMVLGWFLPGPTKLNRKKND